MRRSFLSGKLSKGVEDHIRRGTATVVFVEMDETHDPRPVDHDDGGVRDGRVVLIEDAVGLRRFEIRIHQHRKGEILGFHQFGHFSRGVGTDRPNLGTEILEFFVPLLQLN